MRKLLWAVAGCCGAAAAEPPGAVVAAAAPTTTVVSTAVAEPARPRGGWWRVANRPIFCDGAYRYEPRLRDVRLLPATSSLPGNREALAVLPPYRDGYFRLFGGGR